MSLNETVSAERVHIGFFGMRNAGKSSLVNAVTGQRLSVVSKVKGTTTDPVKKAMELLPIGPVVIIDTPGFDDEGYLGEKRVEKTNEILAKTDIAILVVDSLKGVSKGDKELIEAFKKRNIPYIIAFNKSELLKEKAPLYDNEIYVSATENVNIFELKEKIGSLAKTTEKKKYVVSDLVEKGDIVVLVIPIDEAAPKGRLILPQQMTIRDILDAGAVPVVTRETELETALGAMREKPRMVITDSQAFGFVSKTVGEDIPLTSFSILMARYKGSLESAVKGAEKMKNLNDGDTILISEGCTHHRQCGDIGTVKLPKWISEYTGKQLEFEFTSGRDFPDDLSNYALVIHCGGCMLTEREMQYRARHASDSGIPMSNYGIIIAHTHGILRRSLEPFKDILKELN